MNGETLRLEIGIHRSRSSSSPLRTPLPAGDEQPCSATRTFSCPRSRRVPEEQKSVQNRMKVTSREGLLDPQTPAGAVGMSLRLPWTCTELVVLARKHTLCQIRNPKAASQAFGQPSLLLGMGRLNNYSHQRSNAQWSRLLNLVDPDGPRQFYGPQPRYSP